MAEDFALDLEELRHLRSIAKQPRIVSLLSSEINKLEKLSNGTSSAPQPQIPAPISTGTKVSTVPAPQPQIPAPISTGTKVSTVPTPKYATLSVFSWDQDNEKVRIYVSLEGVEENKIETEFKPMSFDVKFHDIQGKNYRFALPKLHGEIVPEKCKVLVKPTRVVIILVKASKGNWLDLNFKEDKMKPNLDKEKDRKDPMAGIMDMMKKMYEEGDDEVKRAIAKAWTDARSGKTAESLPF